VLALPCLRDRLSCSSNINALPTISDDAACRGRASVKFQKEVKKMELQMDHKVIETDVLIIGGGIAGLQAAIAAAEQGAKVLVAEKADTRRSGCGGMGNDHFMCYIPGVHPETLDEAIQGVLKTMEGPWQDIKMLRILLSRSFELVQKWESYGIEMRPTGDWNFEGHTLPGKVRHHLKYKGYNQKPLLTKKALSVGATIMNKVLVHNLLLDEQGAVVGAVGVSVKEKQPSLVVFSAKAVIITTGNSLRLYPGFNPAYLFNTDDCPANAGAGLAMAYRAGAKLVNIDIPYLHDGPKFFVRSGKATWIGLLSDIDGNSIGHYVDVPTRELGDPTAELWTGLFQEKLENGTGPVYMNCTRTSEADLQHMRESFVSEGDTSINEYLDQYGIDLRKSMVEFGTYECSLAQRGIEIDEHAQSSIPGLFSAGICTGNVKGNITSAAVFGQIAGEAASAYAKERSNVDVTQHPQIEQEVKFMQQFLCRSNGAQWKEANTALQQIMNDYAGMKVRSDSLFRAGKKYLRDLKCYAEKELMAKNSHELMRVLEVLDLLDVGEAVMLCSANRKETRGECHVRSDYTFTNPLLDDKFQTIQKTGDDIKLGFRDMWI